jgi:hypothetical protein
MWRYSWYHHSLSREQFYQPLSYIIFCIRILFYVIFLVIARTVAILFPSAHRYLSSPARRPRGDFVRASSLAPFVQVSRNVFVRSLANSPTRHTFLPRVIIVNFYPNRIVSSDKIFVL